MLEVQNNNTGTNDTALSLKVQSGEPPMKVDSIETVANPSADEVDGKVSTALMQGAALLLRSCTPPQRLTNGA